MAVKLGDLLELVVFYMEADGAGPCRLQAVNLQYKFPLSFIFLYLQEREKIILQPGTYACTLAVPLSCSAEKKLQNIISPFFSIQKTHSNEPAVKQTN